MADRITRADLRGARNPEPVNRGDSQPTGLREAWVTVHDEPDTVTRTPHYAALR